MPEWAEPMVAEDPALEASVRIARLIVKHGGPDALKDIINRFASGDSLESIGQKFGVTKQRICQWRDALGAKEVSFKPSAVIARVLNEGLALI